MLDAEEHRLWKCFFYDKLTSIKYFTVDTFNNEIVFSITDLGDNTYYMHLFDYIALKTVLTDFKNGLHIPAVHFRSWPETLYRGQHPVIDKPHLYAATDYNELDILFHNDFDSETEQWVDNGKHRQLRLSRFDVMFMLDCTNSIIAFIKYLTVVQPLRVVIQIAVCITVTQQFDLKEKLDPVQINALLGIHRNDKIFRAMVKNNCERILATVTETGIPIQTTFQPLVDKINRQRVGNERYSITKLLDNCLRHCIPEINDLYYSEQLFEKCKCWRPLCQGGSKCIPDYSCKFSVIPGYLR
jgi:hypothetical protein